MERRITVVFFLFLIYFSLVVLRLFYWQVIASETLGSLQDKQSQVDLPIFAKRGGIYASDGKPLVINQTVYGLYLEPKKISDLSMTVENISKILEIPQSTISAKLDNKKLIWVPIANKIDRQKKEELEKLELKGVNFIEEAKRFYPEASSSAHLLGFVGKNSKGEDQGYFGLEGFYDEQLKGRNGSLRQDIDAFGNPILSGDLKKIPAEDGRDLYLYLDRTIQFLIETKLKEGIKKYQAKGGTIIVLDPKSGGILAMASLPTYNPDDFVNFPQSYYKNPAVSQSYEPGSTFKTLVMSMAINEGKITPETKFNEEGPINIGGYTIQTWNQKYHGEITMTEVLRYSSNVGMVNVSKYIQSDVFYRYLNDLGFGKITRVDLEDETSPSLRSRDNFLEIDYVTASFGQGIAVTPLQMIRAVAAISNNGNLFEPHIVKSIKPKNGSVINIKPKTVKNVFKKETAAIVAEMMVDAVDNGEARFLKPSGFRVAGKTGTAQIPIAGHYDTEKTIASFIGFAPVEDPKFIMLVTITEPTTSPWGSETAAPLFFQITKDLFSYLKISPS